MNGKTHLLTGLAAGFLLSQSVPPDQAGLIIAATSIAALAPDIDHPQALITSFVPFGSLISWAVGGHRGITHTALAGFVAGGIVYLLTDNSVLALAVCVGWFLHLIGDMFTPSGVPLLLPVRWRFRMLPRGVLAITAPAIEAGIALASLIVAFLMVQKTLGI